MSHEGDALTRIDAAIQAFGQQEQSLREYLRKVSEQLAAVCSRADVHCSGVSIGLEECGDGEWVSGHIFCSSRGLTIASLYSGDMMHAPPDEEPDYQITDIEKCPVEWLPVISSRKVIEEITGRVMEVVLKQTDVLRTRFVDLALVALPPDRAAADDFKGLAEGLGFDRLAPEWRNAQVTAISDPDSAARTACTMIESVCKHILDSKKLDPNRKLNQIMNQTCVALGLDPDPQIGSPLRDIMSGLSRAVNGIGEFRNHASNAHGKGPASPSVTPMQAQLAVNAAGAIVTFLLERWKAVRTGS